MIKKNYLVPLQLGAPDMAKITTAPHSALMDYGGDNSVSKKISTPN
jgi:hypothetical protein